MEEDEAAAGGSAAAVAAGRRWKSAKRRSAQRLAARQAEGPGGGGLWRRRRGGWEKANGADLGRARRLWTPSIAGGGGEIVSEGVIMRRTCHTDTRSCQVLV